jgi:DNA-directed RNA polymerase
MTAVQQQFTHADVTPEQWERQMQLEQEMRDLGVSALKKALQRSAEEQEETGTVYGKRLMRAAILPTAEAIEQFIAKATSGKAGRRHAAVKLLQGVDPKVVAYLTAKTVLDSISLDIMLQTTAVELGSRIEDEVRFTQFRAEHKAYYEKTKKKLQERTSNLEWHRTVLTRAGNKLGVEWANWNDQEKLHLGTKLIDLFIEATGLVRIEKRRTAAKCTQNYIRATKRAMEQIRDRTNSAYRHAMQALPMVVPPKPWDDVTDGGYWFQPHRQLPLVKTRNRNYLEELQNVPMLGVRESVNDIQNTAWRIRREVLDVLEHVYENNLPLGKLPPSEDLELPAKPPILDMPDAHLSEEQRAAKAEALKTWKREAAEIHGINAKLASKRSQVRMVIDLARKFQDEERIWFPHQLDFRGRVYAVPMFLNPQGADWSKGLLTFATGKPIEDERAAGWLAIQGANAYGFDKASLEDRVQWAFDHAHQVKCVVTDPLMHVWWADADKPWRFLAWCYEFAAFLEQGYGFVSSLPIELDGSCNGLQHYSAMLRDEIGGAATNLTPSETPRDIYQDVADVAAERVKALLVEGNEQDQLMAQQWLDFGINRKLTKRPVMVLPYGGTQYSCRKYIQEYVKERAAELDGQCPWADPFQASAWMSSIVWNSIGQVVVAARVAMDWLQDVARISAAEGLPITWETPDGFPVLQAYPNMEETRVKTMVAGSAMYLTLKRELPTLDKRRQQNGIAPNYVHSMDGCALRQYAMLFRDSLEAAQGEKCAVMYALVHDSFGTLAADTDVSAACLRHAFVEMYEQRDVLSEFQQSILEMLPEEKHGDLPPLPGHGNLDLETVKESEYFFA